mmetsp:Transcript_7784/g.17319  ORF Transcript_7784/g.17319 Transcript_7784/m.17319 type:complete len:82 (+) Transcript_7784:1286-1531(+)
MLSMSFSCIIAWWYVKAKAMYAARQTEAKHSADMVAKSVRHSLHAEEKSDDGDDVLHNTAIAEKAGDNKATESDKKENEGD